MRALLASLLVIGCGSSMMPPVTPASPTEAAPAAFGAGPPLVTPGERMTYRVQLGGVELAQMTLAVGELTDLAGARTVVVQGHAKSVGLASMVTSVDDTFTSWLDVGSGRSRRFAVDELATKGSRDIEHTIADLAAVQGNQLPITFALNDAAPTPEPQTLSLPEPWDYNAFLVALRAWEAKPGTTQAVEVLRSRWLWHIDVTVGPTEELSTALGPLPALRFDAVTYRLERNGKRDAAAEERKFSVWISDDDGRVPLLVSARTDWGDVKMEIVEYVPGTGTRLRP